MISTSLVSALSPAPRRRCWHIMYHCYHPSSTARHYGHVFLAILFFFVAQMLTCAWDQPFWEYGSDFPGQIVAMVFVWLFMWAVQLAFFRPGEGLERAYHRYLRAPTEVLNKHMSIGFTVPFLSLISQSFAGGNQVGLLTTAFVVTGALNAVFVYAVTYHVQVWLTKLWHHTRRYRGRVLGCVPRALVDIRHPTRLSPCQASADHGAVNDRDPSSRLDRFRKHVSDVSTLCTLSGYASDSNGLNIVGLQGESAVDAGRPEDALRTLESGTGVPRPEEVCSRLARTMKSVFAWGIQNIFLALSIMLFLFFGLPLSSLHSIDLPLDVGFLFTVWLIFTSAQTRVKQHLLDSHPLHRKALTAIATLLNPVLWTSLFLLCYGLAKSHIRAAPIATIVERFKTGTTVSDLIAHHFTASATSPSPPLGAGDIATSILNAGIVSWGLKLFEYRAQLLSRGGLTVLLTSALSALFNVVAWPLLANTLGVRPAAYSLSFAARSVTIALGGPAMASLGGDAGVNAVGVVVNGIVFQLVAGLFLGSRGDRGAPGPARWRVLCKAHAQRFSLKRWPGTRGSDAEGPPDAEEVHVQRPVPAGRRAHDTSDEMHVDAGGTTIPLPASSSSSPPAQPLANALDDAPTVAAGVTIGINAAAMGTAHLYEQNSHAAPYSALAMTMFGVFTVLFTVQSPMVEWLKGMMG